MAENNKEILDAIQELAEHLDGELARTRNELKEYIDGELARTRNELKNYIDEKLYDLRGDIIVLTRKEDIKLEIIVRKLRDKNIFNDEDMREVLTMEPFPKSI